MLKYPILHKLNLLELPHVALTGNLHCYVENYTHIVQYTNTHILIEKNRQLIHIDGVDLMLTSLTEDCIQIAGRIAQVRYEEK